MSKATCAGNCNERLKSNCKRPGWPVTDYRYFEKVFTNLRRKLNRTEDDDMFDLKTNVLIWWLFMSTTIKAAIHLGLEYDQILIACQNTKFEGIKTLFNISLMLIAENSFEILNLATMMYDFSPWMTMTLRHDQAIKWAKTKVHVHSDPVLCLGRINQPSEANIKWKEQIHYFQQ